MFLGMRKRVTLTLLLTALSPTAAAVSTAPITAASIPANTSDAFDPIMTTDDVEMTTAPAKDPVRRYGRIGNCIFYPNASATWLSPPVAFRDNKIFITSPLATVGTILIFLVNGKRMFKGSPYLYMCVLALADLSYVFANSLDIGVEFTSKGKLYLNDIMCATLGYFVQATQAFAISVLMAMTVERMLVILFPFKLQHFFTVKKAIVILFIMFLCSYASFVPYAMARRVSIMQMGAGGPKYVCGYLLSRTAKPGEDPRLHGLEIDISFAIKNYIYLILPMILLLGCNVAIIVAMTTAVRAKGKLTGEEKGGGQDKSVGQLRHITAQVLSVSILYVVVALPFACTFHPLSQDIFKPWYERSCKDYLSFLWYRELVRFLYDFNHCINAYIYAVSSKKFRTELLEALNLKSRKNGTSASGSGRRQTALPSASGSTIKS